MLRTYQIDLEDLIDPLITFEDDEMLAKIPEFKEILATLKKMSPEKAPDLDGMTIFFFKFFWEVVGLAVVRTIQDFFVNDELLPALNHTNLTLILKVDNPSKVSQFRPISLCNFIYKIISKIMTERLKIVLPMLISPFQLAFVSRSAIQDNYIIVAEIFHCMNHKQGLERMDGN